MLKRILEYVQLLKELVILEHGRTQELNTRNCEQDIKKRPLTYIRLSVTNSTFISPTITTYLRQKERNRISYHSPYSATSLCVAYIFDVD